MVTQTTIGQPASGDTPRDADLIEDCDLHGCVRPRLERELLQMTSWRKEAMDMWDAARQRAEKAERELAEAQSATVPSKRESIVTTLGDDSILYLQPMLFDEGDRVEVTITLAPTDDRGAG